MRDDTRPTTIDGDAKSFDLPIGPGWFRSPPGRKALPTHTDGAVYVILDATSAPLYVGMSTRLRNRIHSHESRPWFNQVQAIAWIEVGDLAAELEEMLIRRLRPPHNVAGHPDRYWPYRIFGPRPKR